MGRGFAAAAIALAGAAGLNACGPDAPPSPTASDLAVVTQALDQQLNQPAGQIREGLRQANADKRIYPEELYVRGDGQGRLVPVDWWDYRQGLIRLAGVDAYSRGYFGLTPKGQALLKGPAPAWLASRFKGAPQVSCEGTRSAGTCTVTGVAQVAPTGRGAALFEGRAVADQPFQATVQYDASGWSVQDLKATGAAPPPDAAQRALLGDDKAISRARQRFALEVNRKILKFG